MVGDPKQAIHGYAGASKDFMRKKFTADFNATKLRIKYNYRSSKKIIELVNTISPYSLTINPEMYYEGIVAITSFKTEEDEAD